MLCRHMFVSSCWHRVETQQYVALPAGTITAPAERQAAGGHADEDFKLWNRCCGSGSADNRTRSFKLMKLMPQCIKSSGVGSSVQFTPRATGPGPVSPAKQQCSESLVTLLSFLKLVLRADFRTNITHTRSKTFNAMLSMLYSILHVRE
jgi:hypothetical protein